MSEEKTLQKLDEMLEILQDGKERSLTEICEITNLRRETAERVVNFLATYGFLKIIKAEETYVQITDDGKKLLEL